LIVLFVFLFTLKLHVYQSFFICKKFWSRNPRTFSILAFRTSLTFVCGLNFSKTFCLTTDKNILGSNFCFFGVLIVWCVVNPFKADFSLSSNFNCCFGNKLMTFFLKVSKALLIGLFTG